MYRIVPLSLSHVDVRTRPHHLYTLRILWCISSTIHFTFITIDKLQIHYVRVQRCTSLFGSRCSGFRLWTKIFTTALMQLTEPNWYRLVYYSSQKLSDAERNFSTTEGEALGMIYSINRFRHYRLGRKFIFHVDHAVLLYLLSKQSLTGKSVHWILLLHELKFEIQHRLGAQHVVIDYLSRIEN